MNSLAYVGIDTMGAVKYGSVSVSSKVIRGKYKAVVDYIELIEVICLHESVS